ncbi:hypothetical protein KPG71_11945 [Roseovarius sp. PS-C2]|nr:hypothetical protein [Roseovarius sp. PS-C2]MBU3260729.1 hypothetical protein [Roseovarius sp. PS-C2]
MTNCFSTMTSFGPGWTFTLALMAAAVAATYLLTKRSDETSVDISQ